MREKELSGISGELEKDVYKENYEMRKKIKNMEQSFRDILSEIYCIGAPLNDNILGYSKDQREIFHTIAQECEYWV